MHLLLLMVCSDRAKVKLHLRRHENMHGTQPHLVALLYVCKKRSEIRDDAIVKAHIYYIYIDNK
jgi:hypothetical protein